MGVVVDEGVGSEGCGGVEEGERLGADVLGDDGYGWFLWEFGFCWVEVGEGVEVDLVAEFVREGEEGWCGHCCC